MACETDPNLATRRRAVPWAGTSAPILMVLLAPVFVHTLWMAADVLVEEYVLFSAIDLALLLLLAGYLATCVVVIRFRNYAVKFCAAIYMMLITLILAEFMVRAALLTDVLVDYDEPMPWIPVREVRRSPAGLSGLEGDVELSVNSIGLRGPHRPLDDAELRILCVGGSTTENLYVTDKRTWPWRLQDMLQEKTGRSGRSVYVGNAGRGGQIARHHDYVLRHYKWAPRFEWIVVLCGINDMGTVLQDKYEQRIARVPQTSMATAHLPENHLMYYKKMKIARMLRRLRQRWAGLRVPAGTVVQDSGGNWIREWQLRRQTRLRMQTVLTEIPDGLGLGLRRYAQDLRRIIETCHDREQKVLFVTQPTLYRRDMPADLKRMIWQGADSAQRLYSAAVLAQVIDSYNRTMIEVCEQEQVDCLDLAAMLPADATVFYDDVHFTISGCERVAQLLAEFFAIRLNPAPQPVP